MRQKLSTWVRASGANFAALAGAAERAQAFAPAPKSGGAEHRISPRNPGCRVYSTHQIYVYLGLALPPLLLSWLLTCKPVGRVNTHFAFLDIARLLFYLGVPIWFAFRVLA